MNTLKIIAVLGTSMVLGACTTTSGGPAGGAARAPESPVGLLVQIQELQVEVRSLRNQAEIFQREQENAQRRQRQMYDDLDRRLRSRERTTGAAAGFPDAGQGSPVTVDAPPGAGVSGHPTSSAAANDQPGEREAYEQAFDMLKQSRYSDAIAAFTRFLQVFPAGAYAASAQYWIAEAHYVNRDYTKALAQFRTVVQRFGSSAKAPDAWLKMGYTQFELGQEGAARATLQELIRRYPGTRVATAAQNRLRQR